MPRKKQGQLRRTDDRQSSGLKVKKVKASVVTTVNDDATKVAPCKAKKVSSTAILNGECLKSEVPIELVFPISRDTNISNQNDTFKSYSPIKDTVLFSCKKSKIESANAQNLLCAVDDPGAKRATVSVITSFSALRSVVSRQIDHTKDQNDGMNLMPLVSTTVHGSNGKQNYVRNLPAVPSLKDPLQYKLPSSVYGSPVSNIEKVLNGMQLGDSILRDTSDIQNTPQNCHEVVKTDANHPQLIKSSTNQKVLLNIVPNTYATTPMSNTDYPKISDIDSDSAQSLPEPQKVASFPKITSPQILEQHISKIISQNAAIVETLDPLWSKRYFRQSSHNSDNDMKKNRRISFDKTGESGPSKLQSALLGNLDTDRSTTPFVTQREDIRERSLSTSAIPSNCKLPFSRFQNKSKEEEQKGNAIKSLLSLKQGRYSQQNVFSFSKDTYRQHPQNPEGSIIKDLLLKTKSESKSPSEANEDAKKLLPTEMAGTVMFQCQKCECKYSDEKSLKIHIALCTAGKSKSGLPNGFLGSKLTASESMPLLNPSALSSSIEDLLKNDCSNSPQKNDNIGHILKSQLLSPLSNKKSPPLKKRKISEPISPNESKKGGDGVQLLDRGVITTSRCRSQSVHLFGGEVQIRDGVKTKRLKIASSLPSLTSSSSSDSNTYSNNETFDDDKDISRQTVVSIAQPIHNSGGTVTHIPPKKSISVPVVMPLPNDMINKRDDVFSFPNTNTTVQNPYSFQLQEVDAQRKQSESKGNVPIQEKEETCIVEAQDNKYIQKDCISNKFNIEPRKTDLLQTFNRLSVIQHDRDESALKLPSICFTPSSPTRTSSAELDVSEQKFLAPARPTSLPLKKKPFTMVGSTLVSPDTPRPKKSCMQLYLNGHAYTYLGLKCSTRSTYCCIYRPQPMYVFQDTDPKLSMYSNWQVVPAKEELFGMTPGQMLSFYNSKQTAPDTDSISTTAKLGEPLSFTHSSYWAFRSLKSEQKGTNDGECSTENKLPEESQAPYTQTDIVNCGTPTDDLVTSDEVAKSEALSDKNSNSNADVEASVSDVEGSNTHDDEDDDEEDDDEDRAELNTDSSQSQPPNRVKIFEGGFKSNEDYTYVRGRGRGKYVCEECGIRCKKPSMLKKHIRTHTDLRPYKCRHCSFAFKTKGNLTKHMKSKAHHKKCTELGIVPVPTTSDDSQIDEEALAEQERFKRKNFISSDGEDIDDEDDDDLDEETDDSDALDEDYDCNSNSKVDNINNMSVSNGNSQENVAAENTVIEMDVSSVNQDSSSQCSVEQEAARSLLHLSSLNEGSQWSSSTTEFCTAPLVVEMIPESTVEKCESFSNVIISSPVLVTSTTSPTVVQRTVEQPLVEQEEYIGHRPRSYSADVPFSGGREHLLRQQQLNRGSYKVLASSGLNEASEFSNRDGGSTRRYSISVAREARRPCIVQSPQWAGISTQKPLIEGFEQPMDLRISRGADMLQGKHFISELSRTQMETLSPSEEVVTVLDKDFFINKPYSMNQVLVLSRQGLSEYDTSASNAFMISGPSVQQDQLQGSVPSSQARYYSTEMEEASSDRAEMELQDERHSPEIPDFSACSPASPGDSFAIQENADVANSPEEVHGLSKTQMELMKPGTSSNMEDGKCICRICNKIFAKAGQLRIHVNIHYFERPFRCDNCGVSFRTKGHLQKHKRSVSHYNKVNMNMTFGTPSVDNPRPFKCADCKIAFRIHGHLAKHLRSKMHIMKLECLGKLPFGMYAEMERSGVSLNEIDTTDCNNSLESLQVMAQKLYQRDPRRMRWHSPGRDTNTTSVETAKSPSHPTSSDGSLPIPDQLPVSSPSATSIPVPSIVSLNPKNTETGDVKHEPSEAAAIQSSTVVPEVQIASPPQQYTTEPNRTISQSSSGDSATMLHRSDTCHICGRMFKSAKFLQVHLYCDHSSWNPSVTETLPTTSSSTQQSSRVTVIAQDLLCDLCGRHFPNQNTLQQHLLTHTQLRPFVCEVCDAGFTSSASLMSHLQTHHASDVGTSE